MIANQIKTTFVNTGEIYRRVIDAPDADTRERIFIDDLIAPMKPMIAPMMPMVETDPLGTVRMWNLLMPEDLTTTPELLVKLEAADIFAACDTALEEGVRRFAPFADRLPVREVTGWLILLDPSKADSLNRGYAGFQWHTGHLMVTVDTANDYTLPRLPAATVHELHHIMRLNVFPWDMMRTSVADYIVLEGMAESFATQLYGDDVLGYFATDLSDDELATAKTVIRDGLDKTGFNVIRGYIFGDDMGAKWGFEQIGMPRFGGYAIGYRVVQAYLKRTGKTVEEATFVPTADIIHQSGYFDA